MVGFKTFTAYNKLPYPLAPSLLSLFFWLSFLNHPPCPSLSSAIFSIVAAPPPAQTHSTGVLGLTLMEPQNQQSQESRNEP